MFLIDVSSSMGKLRSVHLQNPKGQTVIKEMTNLEWSLQFVKLKIQEMVFIIIHSLFTNLLIHRTDIQWSKDGSVWCSCLWLRRCLADFSNSLRILTLTIETSNVVNTENGGYDNVLEYIPIAQPSAATIAKVDALQVSPTSGDRMSPRLHLLQDLNKHNVI